MSYTCPNSWTLAGNTCVENSGNTVPANVTGYNCPSGYTLSGSTCSQTTTSNSPAIVTYSCPDGWTLSGTTCTTGSSYPATPTYGCPNGYTLSGSTCTGPSSYTASPSYDCHGQGSPQPYAGSPSGYKCTTETITTSDYDDPQAQCQSIADSMGLPLVGTALRNNGKLMDCTMGPVVVYTCPSGGSLSGTTCNTTDTQPASVTGYTCPSGGSLSGSSCITTASQPASPSYSCPGGQTLSGTTCSQTTTNTTPGTPSYGCPGGYNLSWSSCIAQGSNTVAATASFTCPNGGTLSGAHCANALFRTRYEPYGKTAAGVEPNDIGFTGHVNDANTGLVYMQQRYYDPVAGRFQSVDPVVTDANTGNGFGLYHYAQNNPYRYTDPDGREGMDWVHGVLTAASFCPSICGSAFSAIDGAVSLAQGDNVGAGISLAAAVVGVVSDAGAVKVAGMAVKEGVATSKGVSTVEKTASGARVGDFTKEQKEAAKAENAAANGGQMKCADCGKGVESIKNEKGVSTPSNQAQVHHDPAIKDGGGKDSTATVLCPNCHQERHKIE